MARPHRNLARQKLTYLVHLDGGVVLGIVERVGGQDSARLKGEGEGAGGGTAQQVMKEGETLMEFQT